MCEMRFQLDEDSVCYGCSHVENDTGVCTCNVPCVDGSMNDYDEPLKDTAMINFINSVGAVAKSIKPGETIVIPCNCGGMLTIGRAKINGHIHAHCDKCKQTLMQ